MTPTKIWFNPIYDFGDDVWKISSWISECNDLCNSKYPCWPNASHQALVHSNIWFEDFQYGNNRGHLGYLNRMFLVILKFHVEKMPRTKFLLNPINSLRGNVVWKFQDDGDLGYWVRTILTVLNLHVAQMPPVKFQFNQVHVYGLGGDAVWRISRCPPWQPSEMSELNNFSNFDSPCLLEVSA